MDDSNEYLQLDEYSDEDLPSSETDQPRKKTRKSKTWITAEIYDNKDGASEWLKQNTIWSFETGYDTEAGYKKTFRCNMVKSRGPQCSKAMQFQYNSENSAVIRFETSCEHTHDDILVSQSKIGINNTTKEAIKKQLKLGIKKPKTISSNLAKEHQTNPEIKVPNKLQLTNFIQTLKGPNQKTLNFGQLIMLLKEHATIPEDLDEPFIMYQIKIDEQDNQEVFPPGKFNIPIENESFRFFVTTRRLLSIASKSKFIHADSTYKLIWNNFPVLVCGTSDMDKVFHPFGLAVCTSEKENDFQFMFESLQVGLESTGQPQLPTNGSLSLIADAADAITNGFKAVFSTDADFKRRMCWFHMKKAVTNSLAMLADSVLQNAMLRDIDVLQVATSEQQFNFASKLFIQKYSCNTNSHMKKFIKYFNNEWLHKHVGWYEGYLEKSPSTNNGLESINSTIKKEHTFRVRMPVAEFISTSLEINKDWSEKRDPNSVNHPKSVAQEPTIETKDFTSAYNWLKETKIIQKDSLSTKQFFFKSKLTTMQVSKTSIRSYRNALTSNEIRTFDEYSSTILSIWHVMFEPNTDETNWKNGKCSCPAFHKSYICKHVIGLAARLKFVIIPNLAKNVPIGEKRQRGRPALALKALHYQICLTPTPTCPTPSEEGSDDDDLPNVPPAKRRRGRPRKILITPA